MFLPKQLSAQGNEIVVVGAQYDLPRVANWSLGRIVIIGDAAHAVSTSSGQGANQALESAVWLALCLREVCRTEQPDIEKRPANIRTCDQRVRGLVLLRTATGF